MVVRSSYNTPNEEPRKEYRPRDCDFQTEPSTNDADAAVFSLNDWDEWFAQCVCVRVTLTAC